MAARRGRALLPVDVRRLGTTHLPCESCGVRRARIRVRLDPPGRARVQHDLCERCGGRWADR